MLVHTHAVGVTGYDAAVLTVEVDVRPGIPAFTVIGLADQQARFIADNVRNAIASAGFEFPKQGITINLAPASWRAGRVNADLAIAVALLAASQQIPAEGLADTILLGDLRPSGAIRRGHGTLAGLQAARARGLTRALIPAGTRAEAALEPHVASVEAGCLRAVAELLAGDEIPTPDVAAPADEGPLPDLADVLGQPRAIEALKIAAAGHHSVLLMGGPGRGAMMLARRLPALLGDLDEQQSRTATRIASLAGVLRGDRTITKAPLRAPHPSISLTGLLGGGAARQLGEVSLANAGVLYLDALEAWPTATLQELRTVMAEGMVTRTYGERTLRAPASFLLVAAGSGCPCQCAACRCTHEDLAAHRRRLARAVDMFDIAVELERPNPGAVAHTTSEHAEADVAAARARLARRTDQHAARRQRVTATAAALNGGDQAAAARTARQLTRPLEDLLDQSRRAA